MHQIEEQSPIIQQLILVTVFLALNTIFNIYNKWLFTAKEKDGAGFTVPVFTTITHALAGFIVAALLGRFSSFYKPKEITGVTQWVKVLAIAVFFAVTISCNNASLGHLPLSLQQAIRATSPVAIATCAFFIEKKTFSIQKIATLLLLVFGIILTVASSAEPSPLGLFLVIMSVIFGALYMTFISLHVGPEVKMNTLDILYYTGVPVAVVLTPWFALSDEPQRLNDFTTENGIGISLILLLLGCIMAVTYNLVTFTFVAKLSAVYLSVVANFKLVLLIVLGILIFNETVTWLNVLGLLIAITGFCIYSYLEYQDKKEKERADAKVN